MKLETRGAGASESAQTTPQDTQQKEKRPVLIYILILFIAAFLLMTLSFLSSQHSNEEVLGQLHTNVSALERLQTALEENARLQTEVNEQKDRIEELENQLTAKEYELGVAQSARESDAAYRQKQLDAMTNLYLLEQAFEAKEYERCQEVIQKIEDEGQTELLVIPGVALESPSAGLALPYGHNPPILRFEHIKGIVEEKLAK